MKIENTELIIVFTNKSLVATKTGKLLKITQSLPDSGDDFGNNFFPIIAVNESGVATCLCEGGLSSSDEIDNQLLYIVPDSGELPDTFLSYIIGSCLPKLTRLYVLLHVSSEQTPRQRQQILDSAGEQLSKIVISECHHTVSKSANPKHALGDGLELIAASLVAGRHGTDNFNSGLQYLKTKPEYYS